MSDMSRGVLLQDVCDVFKMRPRTISPDMHHRNDEVSHLSRMIVNIRSLAEGYVAPVGACAHLSS